ncbi:nitronate monooxygenase [Glaesserella parasuis]|nr:nitronate monooxygenase [Glaesserella parasuis]
MPDALKAQKLGADILVLTGFDEGGTLPMKEIGSFNVLAEFVGKVDLPMMLAGGIADKQAVQTAIDGMIYFCRLYSVVIFLLNKVYVFKPIRLLTRVIFEQ